VYNDSKLRKTSDFYEIDYFSKSDVIDWLTNLEKYSKIKDYTLTDEEIEIIWDTLGGSPWEIQLLLSKRFDADTKSVCAKYVNQMKSLIADYVFWKEQDEKLKILKYFVDKNSRKIEEFKNVKNELLKDMVHNNILYFNPVNASFSPQGRSIELGIKMYFENNNTK